MIYQDILHTDALERYAADLNARARKCNAPGTLSAAGLRGRILASAGLCEWCGVSLVQSPFELDHVVSLRQGGDNTTGNLVVACSDCNRRKGQKHPARFAAETYSATGRRTELIDKVLRHFALEPREQMPLFGADRRDQQQRETLDAQDQPHYRW